YRWFMSRAVPVKDAAGRVVQWIGTSTDIHQRKLAEEALRASEARLAGIIGSATDAILTINERHEITLFNSAAEQMFDCPTAEALGRPLDQFIPELFQDVREGPHHPLRRYPAPRVPGSSGRTGAGSRSMRSVGVMPARRTDGAEFPVEATISPVVVGDETYYT